MPIKLKLSSIGIAFLLLIGGCSDRSTEVEDDSVNSNSRLNLVKERGSLICGVNGELPGFGFVDENGVYSGLDVDLCRAVASAVFDNPNKVEFRNLDAQTRFTAVQSGEVDLLSRNTTWTLSRDTSIGMEFAPTTFYDGQGILTTRASKIESVEDLSGKSVCVLSGTTNKQNLADRARKIGLNYSSVVFEDADSLYAAYEEGRCDAATSDRSQLTARLVEMDKPEDHQVLDLVLSKEPLGPLTANGDSQWFDVVKWVTYAMVRAEELGITSENVDSFAETEDPQIRRFLGLDGKLGENLGLPNDFARKIVKYVGNYGEVYERNIGEPFNLDRGLNALWTDGGLMYSPPFR